VLLSPPASSLRLRRVITALHFSNQGDFQLRVRWPQRGRASLHLNFRVIFQHTAPMSVPRECSGIEPHLCGNLSVLRCATGRGGAASACRLCDRTPLPCVQGASSPYGAFLRSVIACHDDLVAQWLLIGFIHGVMNTDNTSIAGETIDYGPCAFLDVYDPTAVFSSIDHTGRYAYANQPHIGHWNLARFAETLLPMLARETDAAIEIAQDALAIFRPGFEAAYRDWMRAKIGLASALLARKAMAVSEGNSTTQAPK
jgi:Protein adenylyltransferase SelO